MKNTVWFFPLFLLLLSCKERNVNIVESRADLKTHIEFKKVPDSIILNKEYEDQQESTLKAIIKDQVILNNYYKNGHSRIITNFTNAELACNVFTAE